MRVFHYWVLCVILNPILEGIYVLHHVKGVVGMVILCVNDENFLPALDTFGKNTDHTDAGLQPAAALWSLREDTTQGSSKSAAACKSRRVDAITQSRDASAVIFLCLAL